MKAHSIWTRDALKWMETGDTDIHRYGIYMITDIIWRQSRDINLIYVYTGEGDLKCEPARHD